MIHVIKWNEKSLRVILNWTHQVSNSVKAFNKVEKKWKSNKNLYIPTVYFPEFISIDDRLTTYQLIIWIPSTEIFMLMMEKIFTSTSISWLCVWTKCLY